MQPLLSVIIPVYNGADCIERAVASAARQKFEFDDVSFSSIFAQAGFGTSTECEIIIVDDGSTDNTQVVLQTLQAIYPSVRVLTHPANKGVSAARNTGTAAAEGHFIAYLDCDDVWSEHKSALQILGLLQSGKPLDDTFSLTYFWYRNPDGVRTIPQIYVDENASKKPNGSFPYRIYNEQELIQKILTMDLWFCGSNLLAHRDAIHKNGGFLETWGYSEDIEIIIRLVAKGGHISLVPKALVGYDHPTSDKKYANQQNMPADMVTLYRCHIAQNWGADIGRRVLERLGDYNNFCHRHDRANMPSRDQLLAVTDDAPCRALGRRCTLLNNPCVL